MGNYQVVVFFSLLFFYRSEQRQGRGELLFGFSSFSILLVSGLGCPMLPNLSFFFLYPGVVVVRSPFY